MDPGAQEIPKSKLVPTELSLQTDRTGITGAQKTVLLGAWTFFKSDNVENAIKMIIKFLNTYPDLRKKFKFAECDPKKNPTVEEDITCHAHAIFIFNAFGSFIEYGLKDIDLLDCQLFKVQRNHRRKGIKKDDFVKFAEVLTEFFEELLGDQMVSTFPEAFKVFLDLIVNKCFDE